MAGGEDTPSGVSGRYATALFELALEAKALDQVEQDLNRFNQAL
ncbi:MAG TPA: F0F1 ATP synthase subunit delta, partial [Methyloceanibacter sp.]|nr:F0F1 ATP synthase subunit delta [Methyloceanibacter sp.]